MAAILLSQDKRDVSRKKDARIILSRCEKLRHDLPFIPNSLKALILDSIRAIEDAAKRQLYGISEADPARKVHR